MKESEGEVFLVLQSKRSLTFFQSAMPTNSLIDLRDVNASIFATTMQGQTLTNVIYSTSNSIGTINTLLGSINSYNAQFQSIYSTLNEARASTEQVLSELLANNPSSDSMRNIGVSQMWDYLKAEAQMGGNSSGFTPEQQRELLERGRIRNFEGHHINSVDAHPGLQANPDNVAPLEEHRFNNGPRDHFAAHNNNWRNPTEGQLLDRNQVLTETNNQRVSEKQLEIRNERSNIIKNEIIGVGAAIAIGFGVGFTIGFVAKLAQNGLSVESVRVAAIAGIKSGAITAVIGGISYGLTRTIGEVAVGALTSTLTNLGIEVTKNIAKLCSMSTIGMLSIILFSTYQFVQLKRMGYGTMDALIRVGKQALFSLTVLFVTIVAQGLWGGHAGLIVSTSIGLVVVSYKTIQTAHNRLISKEIQLYTINKCCPSH